MHLPEIKLGKTAIEKIIYQSKGMDLLAFGIKSGIFEEFGNQSRNPEEIAQRLGFKSDITEALLNVYLSLELVEKNRQAYKLTPESQEYLLKASPLYQGEVLTMSGNHNDILKELPQKIRGESCESHPSKMWINAQLLTRMAKFALSGMVQQSTEFITSLNEFKTLKTMCDLGGNHGSFSMALIDKSPELKSDIIDLPQIKTDIEDYISSQNYENNISAIGLDLNKLETLDQTYDLALASNILQIWKADLGAVFAKINKILNPGGIFVSNHFLQTQDNDTNLPCSCHELFTRLRGYPSHFLSEDELKDALMQNGFADFQTKEYKYDSIPCLLLSAKKK
jgi:ubiquinone/menaquinone biosynthesis C-methylase UbiE